jgi:hypothetical protein
MRINVNIFAVDGESSFTTDTGSATAALAFLRAYDHEGSGVSVSIQVADQEAYRLLEMLEAKVVTATD